MHPTHFLNCTRQHTPNGISKLIESREVSMEWQLVSFYSSCHSLWVNWKKCGLKSLRWLPNKWSSLIWGCVYSHHSFELRAEAVTLVIPLNEKDWGSRVQNLGLVLTSANVTLNCALNPRNCVWIGISQGFETKSTQPSKLFCNTYRQSARWHLTTRVNSEVTRHKG